MSDFGLWHLGRERGKILSASSCWEMRCRNSGFKRDNESYQVGLVGRLLAWSIVGKRLFHKTVVLEKSGMVCSDSFKAPI